MVTGCLDPVAVLPAHSGLGAGYARRFARATATTWFWSPTTSLDSLSWARTASAAHNVGLRFWPPTWQRSRTRRRVRRLAARVTVLVNNAGFGMTGEFWRPPLQTRKRQLDVNVAAVMHLTRYRTAVLAAGAGKSSTSPAIAGLLSGRVRLLGVQSLGGVLLRGLASGLTGTGVTMHAVCPGFVRTEFHQRAGIDMSSIPDLMWLSDRRSGRRDLADIAKARSSASPVRSTRRSRRPGV